MRGIIRRLGLLSHGRGLIRRMWLRLLSLLRGLSLLCLLSGPGLLRSLLRWPGLLSDLLRGLRCLGLLLSGLLPLRPRLLLNRLLPNGLLLSCRLLLSDLLLDSLRLLLRGLLLRGLRLLLLDCLLLRRLLHRFLLLPDGPLLGSMHLRLLPHGLLLGELLLGKLLLSGLGRLLGGLRLGLLGLLGLLRLLCLRGGLGPKRWLDLQRLGRTRLGCRLSQLWEIERFRRCQRVPILVIRGHGISVR